MKAKTQGAPNAPGQDPSESLDALNARLRSPEAGAGRVRQAIEAHIERKARRRRKHEVSASSALKAMTKERA